MVSLWALCWIVGQVQQDGRSPLDVVRLALGWADVPTHWLDTVTGWLRDDRRHGLLGALAVTGGLLWSATTERGQLPALLGWLAVMTAAEGIGYGAAVDRALIALAAFVLLLLAASVPGRKAFVLRRIVLMPRDVLVAGITAATLSAVVPLLAPGLAVVRLCRPYVTRPPAHPRNGTPLTNTQVHGVVDP